MRVAHYLTRGETGRYYVRLRIPADLQARFGRKVVKRSTGTTCDRAALGYALLMQQRYARAFAAIRNGSMGSELDELLRSLEGTSSLELILKDVKLAGGASFGQVEINDGKDLSLFQQLAAQHSAPSPVPSPTPFPPRRTVKPIGEARPVGLTLADARDKYLVSIQGKNTAKTIVQKTRALKDLEVFLASQRKNKRPALLKELTRQDFSEWFLHETGQKRVITYITNRFSACADFIKWAQTAGHYPQGDNPASGHASVPKQLKKQRAKSHGSQAFTPDQVKRIFDPENFKHLKGDAARWLPLILLYTGARSNEVARLELEDCREEDGIPIFHFTWMGEDKSLKTDASDRKTPVHPDLIKLGLWERVERLKAAGETKLFPELSFDAKNGPAGRTQHAFSRYLVKLGIKARGGGRVGHHSFRDTVIGALKAAGVHREMREEYTGHELSDRQEHAHAYETEFAPRVLAETCHPKLMWAVNPRLMGWAIG
ncbi:integrase [Xanthomonas translucens pv. poae]|uniref:Integrase n=2 Tax=Xanthomonas translucens group TaxID=3390202 RepID=A0A0K3AA03_9XANT|nr:site-specific integrase [Xanthomonas translucens]UKE63974.1 site-specific integrase [Xanthomonas translucens pv. poae]CTP93399.1 integrase [Xanthomonas translucens pv. poae]